METKSRMGGFTAETKLRLADGTIQTLAELARLGPGEVFYVFPMDHDEDVVVGEGMNARMVQQVNGLVELTLDPGAVISCAPEQQFILASGDRRTAEQLGEERLMTAYFDNTPLGEGGESRLWVLQRTRYRYELIEPGPLINLPNSMVETSRPLINSQISYPDPNSISRGEGCRFHCKAWAHREG